MDSSIEPLENSGKGHRLHRPRQLYWLEEKYGFKSVKLAKDEIHMKTTV